MRNRIVLGVCAVIFYALMIVLANVVTVHFGLMAVGFGLVATAGTYLAGFAFVGRNMVQETLGRKIVLAAIFAGGILSWFLASHALAIASATAFLISETTDYAVYTPIRARAKASRGWALAAVGGNIAGALVDTFVFLTLAGFPVLALFPGQMVGKAYATAVFLAVGWVVRRVVFREPVKP